MRQRSHWREKSAGIEHIRAVQKMADSYSSGCDVIIESRALVGGAPFITAAVQRSAKGGSPEGKPLWAVKRPVVYLLLSEGMNRALGVSKRRLRPPRARFTVRPSAKSLGLGFTAWPLPTLGSDSAVARRALRPSHPCRARPWRTRRAAHSMPHQGPQI